jgi:hypothetical protein
MIPVLTRVPLLLLLLIAISSSNDVIVEVHSLSSQLLSENSSISYSILTNTKWKIQLDIGLQPGTWMPKRYPGWAESGSRLVFDATIEFTDDLLPSTIPGEPLVGPKDQTGIIRVNNNAGAGAVGTGTDNIYPSTFVSEFGTQNVTFNPIGGGWCIQRPTSNVRNANGIQVKPAGILSFWLDCTSGATRRDVVVQPNTRIFFTTGVWDDPLGLIGLEDKYKKIINEIQTIEEKTKETRRADLSADENKNKNWLNQIIDTRKMFVDAEEYDKLLIQKKILERSSPPKNSAQSKNGVKIAPTGSLVIKGKTPPLLPGIDWLPTNDAYFILGTFTTKSLLSLREK